MAPVLKTGKGEVLRGFKSLPLRQISIGNSSRRPQAIPTAKGKTLPLLCHWVAPRRGRACSVLQTKEKYVATGPPNWPRICLYKLAGESGLTGSDRENRPVLQSSICGLERQFQNLWGC